MQRTKLGRTDIEVSAICLGTMTWGSQNSEDEGHAQIERALDVGVDFMDTASAGEVERAIAELDAKIKRTFPDVTRVFIEAEARKPRSA